MDNSCSKNNSKDNDVITTKTDFIMEKIQGLNLRSHMHSAVCYLGVLKKSFRKYANSFMKDTQYVRKVDYPQTPNDCSIRSFLMDKEGNFKSALGICSLHKRLMHCAKIQTNSFSEWINTPSNNSSPPKTIHTSYRWLYEDCNKKDGKENNKRD